MSDKSVKCSQKTEAGLPCKNWAIRWDGETPDWHVDACSSHWGDANNYYSIKRRKRLVQLKLVMEELGLDSSFGEQLMKEMERRVGWFDA